jgi:hypothetical protein
MNRPLDLEKLPYLARVAFAARCARRVQALLGRGSPDVPEGFWEAVDHAITLAERAGADGWPGAGLAKAVEEAERRARGALGVAQVWACGTGSGSVPPSAPVRRAVAYTAAAAACAALETSVRATSKAMVYAEEAARAANAVHVGPGMVNDFETLKEAAGREGWEDDHPVPPEFFRPL